MELFELLLASIGVGSLFGWQSFRRVRHARQQQAFIKTLAPAIEIALHVAEHEARSRAQPLSPVHLIYGLLQDEDFVVAITKLGGDATAVEQAVHAELDRNASTINDPRDAYTMIARASYLAQQSGRQATLTDLWNYLGRAEAAKLVECGPIERGAMLFLLMHKLVAPPAIPDATAVHIVLRNDDYTSRDFVVAILREVFELPQLQAVAIMSAAHDGGRAIVGRFAKAAAKAKIDAVRTKARDHGFPLWIGAEAC